MTIIDPLKNYLLGSYAEMKRVSWPSKEQTVNYSLVVIGLSIGLAAFFALLDYFFNWGITQLLTR